MRPSHRDYTVLYWFAMPIGSLIAVLLTAGIINASVVQVLTSIICLACWTVVGRAASRSR